MAYIDAQGREVLDDTPIAVPLKFKRQSFIDHIQTLVRQEMSRMALDQGHESFEEADDFDVGDEDWIRTPYELDADQEFMSMYPVEKDTEEKPDATTAKNEQESAPETGSGAV